jgi:hypothetical protein
LRFGDSNARYIEYNGSRFYFNECEIYSGPSNSLTWNAGNDGAGSGLDADLLDGQQGSWYADIIGRLGYAPVQQGTGIGQQSNAIKIGWNGSKLQLTVDTYDQGNIVTEPNLANASLNVNAAYVQRNNNHLWGPTTTVPAQASTRICSTVFRPMPSRASPPSRLAAPAISS